MRARLVTLGLLILAAVSATGAVRQPQADLIVLGGAIYTADPRRPRADALAVRDGHFVAVGSRADILAMKGATTRVVDLAGDAVVPGLQDAHGHFLGLGASLTTLDLRDTPSVASITAKVAARAAGQAAGRWVVGRGWDQNDWPVKSWPTRQDLDAVAADTPVVLKRIDGHAAWANTKALALAGITADTRDPDGGRLLRDSAGRPTGVLIDTAQRLVERHIPPPSPRRDRRADPCRRSRNASAGADDGPRRRGVKRHHRRLSPVERRPTPRHASLRDDRLEPGHDTRVVRARPAAGPGPSRHGACGQAVADGALGSRGASLLRTMPTNRAHADCW